MKLKLGSLLAVLLLLLMTAGCGNLFGGGDDDAKDNASNPSQSEQDDDDDTASDDDDDDKDETVSNDDDDDDDPDTVVTPPNLRTFQAVAGEGDSEFKLSWELPEDLGTIALIRIAIAEGDTPPTECSDDTTITTFVATAATSLTFKSPDPTKTYSFAACTYDAGGTAGDAPLEVASVQAQMACGGSIHAEGCWYRSAQGESCETFCADHGGVNDLTISYVGSAGSVSNCNAVLLKIMYENEDPADLAVRPVLYQLPPQQTTSIALGCSIFRQATSTAGQTWGNTWWWNDPATTQEAADPGYERVCACNE